MEKKAIKVTFTPDDPFDAQVLPHLSKEKNKAAWLRMAAFCYVQSLQGQGNVPGHLAHAAAGPAAEPQPVLSAKDSEINRKLGKLAF